ncbi:hypothetical protein LPJ66_003116 [Kickxella alabastrina]|uniref:Uncharacterized protein n=1 Tax=Kickxella alabastrina TaxID=61397 RepID=A0ACC1INF0_9FUNG|nr:hypothetical protein LPJ66_003116 [Kickxella alabastrina]
MPCFSQLPFVILNRILRVAIDTNEHNIDAWADRLPLLGVCRGWREVATGLVYCNAVLDGSSKYGLGFVEHSNDTAVEDKLVNTNIGLIKATRNTHLVKTVTIKIDYFEYYRSLLAEANSIFSFETSDWSRVSRLNIDGYLDNNNNDIGSEFQSDIMNDANEFTRQMAKYMPGVDRLTNMTWHNNAPPIFDMTGLLSQMYLRNLKYLYSYEPFTLAESVEPANFTQLTTLIINMNHMQYIPYVCCQNLQTLVLSNVTSAFSWSKLVNTKQAQTIVFPILRKLKLELDESSDVRSIWSSSELQFPALQELSVTVPTFGMLKKFMDFKVLKCPHVTQLYIDISEFNKDSGDDLNILIQRSKNLAASIKQHIPNVTELIIGYYACNSKIPFYDELVSLYIDQLVHVEIYFPITFTAMQFSRELTHLSLNLELNTLQNLPNVLFQTLEYLDLDNVHPTFAWEKMLKNDSTAEDIFFKRLESLNIKYSDSIENEEGSEDEYIALECQQFISSQKEQQKKQSTLNALCPRLKKLCIKNATVPRLQKIMRCGSDQWPCIRSVDIWFQKYDISNVLDIIDSDEYMQATSTFAEYMVKAIPNVNNLAMRLSSDSDKHLKQFCSVVSNGYAHRLIRYDCDIPVVWTASEFSPELRHLNINLDINGKQALPKINASNIEVIEIQGDISGVSWKSFASNSGDSASITFSNLKKLTLYHSDIEDEPALADKNDSETSSKEYFVLRMPKLNAINISDIGNNFGLLNASIEFRHLKNAYIRGSHSVLNLLGNASKARIDKCMTDIRLNSDANLDAFYEATNAFFGSSIKISHAELRLSIHMDTDVYLQKWDSRRIEWTNLHMLTVYNSLKLGAVVDMLARVPKLTKLEAIAILFDEAFEPRLDRVEPISTNINKLYLHASINDDCKEANFDSFKYLILATPSLKKFSLSVDEGFDHMSFVEEYKGLHPHVANIAWERL